MSHNYNVEQLNYIREQIENMIKFNQIEVCKILKKYNIHFTENKYGIHINLSELSNDALDELTSYITYVNKQEDYLNNTEKEKEKYIKTFYKDN